MKKEVSFNILFLLAFFVGFLGIHRYLLRKKLWWLMPITLGGLGIWWFYDIYLLATNRFEKNNLLKKN